MKTFIIASFILGTTTSFAQTLDVAGFKTLLTTKKATLEKVNAGMSKKIVTTSKEGACGLMSTSFVSVLKIEGEKMYILSKEKIQPQNTEACRTAGYATSSETSIVYMEAKPTLANDLADLDKSADDIKSISKSGEIVTMNLDVESKGEGDETTVEKVTIKYDLTKPSFKDMISSQSINYKTLIEDVADVDLKKVDLTKVLFCDNNDDDKSECVEGNYSDILF